MIATKAARLMGTPPSPIDTDGEEDGEIVMMPWGGMMGWGGGFGMGAGLLMSLVFFGVLVGAGALLVRALWDQGGRSSRQRESGDAGLDILRERYARGEIDHDEFEAKKRDLMR